MLGGMSAVLTCIVDSLAAEAIISPFLTRGMFVMGGYPQVAEQTSMVFSFVPFNCRVNKGYILCKKSTVLLLFYTAVYDSDTQMYHSTVE